MKNLIGGLNKIFDSRVRLGIMSLLMVNDVIEFNAMKELLDVTDGNLASHITALDKAGYVQIKKQFIGKKPNTTYSATKNGTKAFHGHLNALESLIKNR